MPHTEAPTASTLVSSCPVAAESSLAPAMASWRAFLSETYAGHVCGPSSGTRGGFWLKISLSVSPIFAVPCLNPELSADKSLSAQWAHGVISPQSIVHGLL